ncbi:MAG: ABC transporter permease [Coriobacteriia bacterium]
MIAPRWRKVARDLTAHKFRTVLVILSIAVGIFAVGVVMGGRGVLIREFDREFAASRPPAISFATTDFDEHVLASMDRRDGVEHAEARRAISLRYTDRPDPGDSSAGWDVMSVEALRDFDDVRVGRPTPEDVTNWPPRAGEVVIERAAKQVVDYHVGDTLTVDGIDGERHVLTITGFAHDINAFPAQFVGSITGFVSMETAEALGEPGLFNRLDVTLADPYASREKASAIADDLERRVLDPAGVGVRNTNVPEPGSHFLGDIFRALSLLLLALGLLALGLSGFLVVNTVSAIMSQQVRQIGIMKAIGGRSSQIMRMYLAMVFAYGLGAILIGVPAALIAGQMFTEFAAEILNFRVVSYAPPAWVVWLMVGVGLLVPVLSALVPIRLGARISVVRAFNATGVSSANFGHGLVDRALGLVRGLSRPVALSLRNTFLRKGRLALTLITLSLASAVVMAVVSERATMLATVDAIDMWWNYDVQVSLTVPGAQTLVEREAGRASGVKQVETWLERPASFERADGTVNESLYVIGLPYDTTFVTPTLVQGRWLTEEDTDAIVVNIDVVGDEPEMSVGRRVHLEIGGVEGEWRVVGVVTGQLMGPVIFADRDRLDSAVGAGGTVTSVLAKTGSHTAQAQERSAVSLEGRLDDAGLSAGRSDTRTSMRDRVAGQFGILVIFLVIMAALLSAVAVIGLTGTMSINVLESTREIGVMRALGASHGSIYRIFITEGIVVAVLAWGIGTIAAYPMSVFLARILGDAMGIPLTFTFSWAGVGMWLASVIVIAVAASMLPAYRASQVSVRDAIAYE